jgi:cardiolipin synthase
MAKNEQIKTYTREVDNSQRMENAVWNEVRREHKQRSEHVAAGLFQSGSGKLLKQRVLNTISSAQQMLVLSSFLFADGEIKQELLKAAARQVNVYMMMAAASRLEQVPDGDSEFEKRVYEDHKRMLNELSPYVYIRSADHFHAKVVLADPFSDSSSGVLLTANLTTDALERNEELAVVLSPDQAREIALVLKCVFWEEAGHHAIDDRLSTVSGLNMIPAPGDLSGVYYNSNSANTLKDRVRSLIQQAEREIVFSTFGIDENHELFSLLLKKLEQGVRVKLFARFRRGKMHPVFQALVDAGAEVYGFYWLHAKAFLIDGTTGFLMTANLEPHGMDSGFELGVDLSHADTHAHGRAFYGMGGQASIPLPFNYQAR